MARSDNLLLSALASEDYALLSPELEDVELTARQVLEEPAAPIKGVYFPESGIASVIAGSRGGDEVEVALLGRDGMTGLCLVNGADQTPLKTVCQIPGRAKRVRRESLVALLAERPAARNLFLLYAQVQAIQMGHTALSNGRHTIDQRLARWLLMAHDRIGKNDLMVTHGFLAIVLGVRRAGVTTALHILEGAHAVRATRGLIHVRDRGRLEAAARDAYGAPETEYRRLLKDYLEPDAF